MTSYPAMFAIQKIVMSAIQKIVMSAIQKTETTKEHLNATLKAVHECGEKTEASSGMALIF